MQDEQECLRLAFFGMSQQGLDPLHDYFKFKCGSIWNKMSDLEKKQVQDQMEQTDKIDQNNFWENKFNLFIKFLENE